MAKDWAGSRNGDTTTKLVKPRGGFLKRVGAFLVRILSKFWGVALLLLLWQAWIVIKDVEPIVMPSPSAVLDDLLTQPGVYLDNLLTTMKVAAIGICLGMGTSLVFAIAAWFSPFLSGLATPPALIAQSVPVVAMIPVIARVIGYNDWAVVTVTGIIVFFPTFVFVSSGLRSVPPGAEKVFNVLRATRLTRLWRLALPAALPGFLLALRVSIATAILGALIAEWLIGTHGLGVLLAITTAELKVATVWGVAVIGTTLSVSGFLFASWLERVARERWT
jgi:NitT/TauT family transport system permease protein